MSSSQWNVFGLIVLLVFLEVIRSKNVRDFFKAWYTNFTGALNKP